MNIIARAAAAVITALCLLLSSCGGGGVPEGAVVLDGVYKAENIAMPQTDHMLGSPVISCGETYLIEWSDDGDYLLTGSGGRYALDGFRTSWLYPDGDEVAFYGMDDGMNDIYGVMKDGQLLWTIPVTEYMKSPLKSKMSGELGTLFMMKAKDLWYIIGEKDIVIIDESGTVLKHITADGSVVTAFEYKDKVSVITANRHLILSGTDETDGPPWNAVLDKKYSIVGGTDKDTALVRQADTLIKVNAADLSEELLINFTNSGIQGSNLGSFEYESDDLIWCVIRGSAAPSEAYKLTRVGRRVIERDHVVNFVYFETGSGGGGYGDAAYLFNKKQNEYFVQLKPYKAENVDAYIQSLDLTVISGGDCDLVELWRDTDKYISKGLFLDLYDGVVKPDDLFAPARKVFERDGKMPVIPLSFGIWGMSSDGTLTNGGSDWTPGKLYELCRSGAPVQGAEKGSDILHCYGLPDAIYTSFVGESFDKAAFLDFAGFYMSSITGGGEEKTYPLSYMSITGRYSWLNYKFVDEANGHSIIGYPTSDGGRYMVSGYNSLAVMKDAPSAAGAAEFLKFLLSCETELNGGRIVSSVPTTKEGAAKLREWDVSFTPGYAIYKEKGRLVSVTDIMLDENGKLLDVYADQYGEFIPDDEKLFEEYIAFIDSIEPMRDIPQPVLDIINEELSAVEGGRSAGEIADILEKRINLYLQENK